MRNNGFEKKLKLKKVTVAFLSENKMNNLRGGGVADPSVETIDPTISIPTGTTGYDSSCTCLIEQNLFKA